MGDLPMTYKIAFTGHRPSKIGGYDPNNVIRKEVIRQLSNIIVHSHIKHPGLHLITGGALGVDQDVARIAFVMKIPFTIACPCHNMDSKWPVEAQKEFNRLLNVANVIHYVHDGPYNGPKCLQDRNEWMVDNCHELVAVWDGSSGGTHNCIRYASSKKVPIQRIDPNKFGH